MNAAGAGASSQRAANGLSGHLGEFWPDVAQSEWFGVMATACGRRIQNWKVVNGWAGEISPADTTRADPESAVSDQPVEQLTLIPYGCTNIRITVFPKIREG